MATLYIDTDLVRDRKILHEQLLERCVRSDNGCLIYPASAMLVRCQGYTLRVGVSPARIAWALAHPEDHLGVHDLAVHLCEFAWADDGTWNSSVCCNPEHLKKGTHDDVRVMRQARQRQLILRQGGL